MIYDWEEYALTFSDVASVDAAFRVCLDQLGENRAVSGRVYSRRLTAPIAFADLGELLLRLDEVLEAQGFPQAFQRVRTFGSGHSESDAPVADFLEDGMTLEEVNTASGVTATFTLNIISRRNSSWQGHIQWQDAAEVQDFSSALELLKQVQGRIFS